MVQQTLVVVLVAEQIHLLHHLAQVQLVDLV
jgi:hypothetical protein